MAEVPPPKRDAAAASEDEQTTKKQKTEGGTGLKRADGTPWEPITGTLVPIVGGKEGLKGSAGVTPAAWSRAVRWGGSWRRGAARRPS